MSDNTWCFAIAFAALTAIAADGYVRHERTLVDAFIVGCMSNQRSKDECKAIYETWKREQGKGAG